MGYFNTSFSPMERFVIQNLNRERRELTDVLTKMELVDYYRTFHQNIKEYTFSEPHETFFKIDTYLILNKISTDTKKLK